LYQSQEKCIKQLNTSLTEFEFYKSLNMIKYSINTDKYELETKTTANGYRIESLLNKRTMTLGIDNLIKSEKTKNIIESKMKNYSSYKMKLVKDIQKGIEYKNTGKDRLHRKLAKKYNLGISEADSGLAAAIGIIKSSETWHMKTIKNLEDKIIEIAKYLEESLEQNKEKSINKKTKKHKFKSNFFKGKKKHLQYLKNKLEKLQQEQKLSIHFGKNEYRRLRYEREILKELELFPKGNEKKINKTQHNIKRLKQEYQNKRLEYFVEGTVEKGNTKIVIEYQKDCNKEDNKYQLRLIFGKSNKEQIIIKDIKIPKSHLSTFTIEQFNRQANRISYNSKGKLILNCTYNYIKPISEEIEQVIESKGTIGIDIGPHEITYVLVKNDGNPFKKGSFNISTILDKRNKETERNLSEIIEKIIQIGKDNSFYSITIENLFFDNHSYKYRSRKLNRILSKFPFELFEKLIISKTTRNGIKLNKINPAYTSYIGIKKYSNRDDVTSNHNLKSKDYSAALVIGRRGLGLREKFVICIRGFSKRFNKKISQSFSVSTLFKQSEKCLNTTNHFNKSNWSLWKNIKKNESDIRNLISSVS